MREVNAGEMYGFRVVNVFPEDCTEEDWTEFADTASKILKKQEMKFDSAYAV